MWEEYAQKTLSSANMLILQKHAAGCDMCADIKEGIDSLARPETLPQTVAKLNAEVDTYLAPKRRKIGGWLYWSAAAVLLITLGIGWYNSTPQPPQTAGNTLPTADTFSSNTATIVPPDNDSVITIPTPVVHPPKPQLKTGETEPKPIIPRTNNTDYKNIESSSFKNTEDGDISTKESKDIVMEDKFVEKVLDTEEIAETEKVTGKTLSPLTTKKSKKRDIYPSGILSNNVSNSYINNADFNNANAVFNFNTSFQDSVNLNTAQALFDDAQYDSCHNVLQYITVNSLSLYYQQAQMLVAKTFIKQNKKTEAKNVLTQVVFSDENLKKEATKLLETLK
jgi:hypothetical protein